MIVATVSHGASGTSPESEASEPVVREGTVTVIVSDDFESHSSQTTTFLNEDLVGGRRIHRLTLPVSTPKMRTGDRVRVQADPGDSGELIVRPRGVTILERTDLASATLLNAPEPRSSVVAVLDFTGSIGSVSCSVDEIEDTLYFGNSSAGRMFQEMSYGQVDFISPTEAPPRNVFRLLVDQFPDSDPCDFLGWADYADLLLALDGVDLASFQHHVYVLPETMWRTCGWVGLAVIGCPPAESGGCRSWIAACSHADLFAHELGHNLGMSHAATDYDNDGLVDCQYCDTSDIMGYTAIGIRHVNAPHKLEMEWLPDDETHVVTARDGTYNLAALAEVSGFQNMPKAIVVPSVEDPTNPYVVSYRQRVRGDQGLLAQHNRKVDVHRQAPGPLRFTLKVASLSEGQHFEEEAEGISVHFLAEGASSAQVGISADRIPPLPPQSVTAVASARSREIRLTWEMVDNGIAVDHFRIYRNDPAPPPFQLIATTQALVYTDHGRERGEPYEYVVTAVGVNGTESDITDSVIEEIAIPELRRRRVRKDNDHRPPEARRKMRSVTAREPDS